MNNLRAYLQRPSLVTKLSIIIKIPIKNTKPKIVKLREQKIFILQNYDGL